MLPGTITIDIDPMLRLGPVALAWHGIAIAVGIVVGAWLARRYARERGLDRETLLDLVLVIALAGIVGSRVLYLILDEPGALLRPVDWLGTRGFAFYGALIFGTAAVGAVLARRRLSLSYLDALAAGFPLGMAVGRLGDLISGEHHGSVTTVPWGVRYLHPDAEVPGSTLAYHSGALYEIVVALAMLAVVWPLRHRFRRPGMLLWTVIALYGAGRFVIFFWRSDTDAFALGINAAQATSLALVATAGLAALWTALRARRAGPGSTASAGTALPTDVGKPAAARGTAPG